MYTRYYRRSEREWRSGMRVRLERRDVESENKGCMHATVMRCYWNIRCNTQWQNLIYVDRIIMISYKIGYLHCDPRNWEFHRNFCTKGALICIPIFFFIFNYEDIICIYVSAVRTGAGGESKLAPLSRSEDPSPFPGPPRPNFALDRMAFRKILKGGGGGKGIIPKIKCRFPKCRKNSLPPFKLRPIFHQST